jgi:adenine phosphoribosyltransferase
VAALISTFHTARLATIQLYHIEKRFSPVWPPATQALYESTIDLHFLVVRQSKTEADPTESPPLSPSQKIYHLHITSPLPLFSLSTMPTQHTNSAALPESASTTTTDNAARELAVAAPSTPSSTELTSAKISLRAELRNFPDFPIPGIDFVDILPLFANHALHTSLIRALELQVQFFNNGVKPDVIVGLDARGFLFGPSLALALGAGFAPVRKRGKLPGPTSEASFEKEYGQDFFQIQSDAVKKGQNVLVVDDIIATGKQE